MGNVMFEIINEAMAGLDWWNTSPRGDAWQLQQAANLKKALPVRVVRDAFNDVWTSGMSRDFTLDGTRVPDSKVAGSGNWTASNVRIVQTRDLFVDGTDTISTDNWLGYATSNEAIGSMSMSGRLPFPEPSSWTSLNLRARLTGTAGTLSLSVAKEFGESVVVSFHPEAGTLQLWEIGNCLAACDHGTIAVQDPTEAHEVRLKLTRQSANQFLATVLLDGEETTLADVPVAMTAQAGEIHSVGFSGSVTGVIGTPYPANLHQVDDLEATYTCLTCASNFGDDPGPVEQDASEEGGI